MLTIYRSKRSRNHPIEEIKKHTSHETFSEAEEMFQMLAKKWMMEKANSNIDPQQMINKLFTSAEKNKLFQQGASAVKDFFHKAVEQLEESFDKTTEGNPSKNKTEAMDWGKIVDSLKAKSGQDMDPNQIKDEAMDILNQIMDRTEQILGEEKDKKKKKKKKKDKDK